MRYWVWGPPVPSVGRDRLSSPPEDCGTRPMVFNAAAARPGGETSDEPRLGRAKAPRGSALTVDGRLRVYAPIRGPRDGEGPARERRYHPHDQVSSASVRPIQPAGWGSCRHAIAQP